MGRALVILIAQIILHVLRDYPLANFLWKHILPMPLRIMLFVGLLIDWRKDNLEAHLAMNCSASCSSVRGTSYYYLWTWRNKKFHDADFLRPRYPYQTILHYVDWYSRSSSIVSSPRTSARVLTNIHWIPPCHGWMKINTDGTSNLDSHVATCGGVVQDEDGKCLRGFFNFCW